MIKYLMLLLLILFYCNMYAIQTIQPIPVIFDTDMGPDYDDVGALAMLHALEDSGETKILATMASTKYEGVAAVLNVINTYFKKPDIPIGVPHGNALTIKDPQNWSDSILIRYPHNIQNNKDVPDAVALYRKILAQQEDNSVTIITVGFLTNLAALLKSAPDEYASLTGAELVNKKVKKLVSMAGAFPEGMEFNIEEDASSAKYVFEQWPTPVLFSGFEIGDKIKTGLPLIKNREINNSPVKDVYSISIPKAKEDSKGRMSWDQTAVLVAIRGHEPFYRLVSGKIQIKEDGYNTWDTNGGKQHYLIENRPFEEVQALIDKLMMHQPKKTKKDKM